jgi:protein-S-isoprenylcysteine O-methyltransferase Ste14
MELFTTIAEIAGVFVGFGALIAAIRHNEIESAQLGRLRAVVTSGLLVVVAALVPVGLGQYNIPSHQFWLYCSLVFFGLNWLTILLSLRRPENWRLTVREIKSSPLTATFFWLLLELPVQLPLILIMFNVFPDLGLALYLTSIIFCLFEAVFVLAQLVYSQMSPDKPSVTDKTDNDEEAA